MLHCFALLFDFLMAVWFGFGYVCFLLRLLPVVLDYFGYLVAGCYCFDAYVWGFVVWFFICLVFPGVVCVGICGLRDALLLGFVLLCVWV